jgi:hypothetical protein
MLTKYVILTISGECRDAKPTIMLTTKITELEKLHENRLLKQTNGIDFYGVTSTHREKVPIWRLCFVVS